MQDKRSPEVKRLLDEELHFLNLVIPRAFRARKTNQVEALNMLWRLTQTMDPQGIEVRREQVKALANYGLAEEIDHNLYVVKPLVLEWARYFYDDGDVGVEHRKIRDYLRDCMLEDPLYVRDLERLAHQKSEPLYGLTALVLWKENLLERRDDKSILRADLRGIFTVCFPHQAEEVKFYFR